VCETHEPCFLHVAPQDAEVRDLVSGMWGENSVESLLTQPTRLEVILWIQGDGKKFRYEF